MLHPCEFLALPRRHLVLPIDMLQTCHDAYIHIDNPKTRRFARRQHAKISDQSIIAFITVVFGPIPLDLPITPLNAGTFRRRWNAVLQHLGLPHSSFDKGCTPGCLRGSGATAFYQHTEDIPRIAWRGRWLRQRTLEYYLQEVAAQLLLSHVSSEVRDRIACFHNAADALISFFIITNNTTLWQKTFGGKLRRRSTG